MKCLCIRCFDGACIYQMASLHISCYASYYSPSENILVISSTSLRPRPQRAAQRWRLFSEKRGLSL